MNKNLRKPRIASRAMASSSSPSRITTPSGLLRKPTPHLTCHSVDCRAKEAYISQEMSSIKKYLSKLRQILQEDSDDGGLSDGIASMSSLNSLESDDTTYDMGRQLVLLQQQNEEKDRQIRLLQRQLDMISPTKRQFDTGNVSSRRRKVNAATQTDKAIPTPPTETLRTASAKSKIGATAKTA